ncbi:apolipoprotein N-acyltransferase [Thauera linaloolentis]|uniref:Apolipoprotein N-acyltransferase n=1 Tax=Thauera linaloolentis (strain DSM 12138 / JCM 21573 / CCUG 41526 / CIP 105981 / IAM 15112 / NBRC 102519 / 47Lol) TaxID=1123367 RepID=N6ZAI7_THAL4|nr:apolipoprotein N-acyltransferase [Thauera linaloolentis]ENO89204.1 apolipoprotein N-acyltransferase [Thauera linaloolentis 47Lol = DSM 12138]MCM8564315.1 apolipoprotein N-acyltransferase [Thauera linaloolentis]
MRVRIPSALLAGAASVLAFEPFAWFPLMFLSLAVLAHLLGRCGRMRDGFWLGFAWGWGAFIAGVSWLYVALNRYGGMPAPLAGLAIALFCAYLALYPALAGALFVRLRGLAWRLERGRGALAAAAAFGALWLLGEWLRGVLLTGFPWLAAGYSQTPPSPLAGYLPLFGVYGAGGLLAFLAGLLAFADWRRAAGWRPLVTAAAVLAVVLAAGAGLLGRSWTKPAGAPVTIALAQTNFDQSLKWDPDRFADVLRDNLDLVRGEFGRPDPPAILVLPETTLPTLLDYLPEGYLDELGRLAAEAGGDLVLGAFRRDEADHIYNAAISLGTAPAQRYAKQHLVPFGEYSPPLFGWFYRLASIPMSDQTRGAPGQPPMALDGQRIALNICYEDLFGAELIHALPQATLLLNISNLAWYGDSIAQPQHLQIARVRALETGRPMLRSTNTGMTAVVQPDGRVAGVLPAFKRGVLRMSVQGYEGLTPYARVGNGPALAAALAVLLALVALRRAALSRR